MKLRALLVIFIFGFVCGVLVMFFYSNRKSSQSEVHVSHTMVLEKIESIGNLEVVKYNIQDIVEYKKVRQWLPNAKTALVVAGEVIVCVDLTKIRPQDIYTSGDSIRLILPSPQICHIKVDHSRSRVYNMEFGLWESEQIMDEAYRHAEKQLQSQAEKLDMDSKARDNTVNLLRPLLQAMGFKEVAILFQPSGNAFGER